MAEAIVIQALKRLGERLSTMVPPVSPVRVFIVGGVAGLLTHRLSPERTTTDCDVMSVDPGETWQVISEAASEVAGEFGLTPDWLNRRSAMFAWQMPLGWEQRSAEVASFGPLRVWAVSRFDLIASKVMAAPKRPQDRADLMVLKPTASELEQVKSHLQRVESESEPGACDAQHAVVAWLEGALA
jgi:hypothetical protein